MTAADEQRFTRFEEKLDMIQDTLASLKSDHELVADLKLDVYGEPGSNGNGDGKPGIKANVRSLLQSRKMIRVGLSMLWAVLLVIAGAVVRGMFGE